MTALQHTLPFPPLDKADAAGTTLPRTLTKVDLRRALGCEHNFPRFRTMYITDGLLLHLGMSREQWTHVKELDVDQTRAVIQYLNLSAADFCFMR